MKLSQLHYFVKIVEAGGFVAASKAISVAQPALSRQISELEHELGAVLLNRGRSGVSLTDAGRRFYVRAHSILDQVELARRETKLGGNEPVGEVKVALPVGAAALIGPKLVVKMSELYPEVFITIVDGLGYQSGEIIETGQVDLGIVPNAESLAGAHYIPVLEEQMYLVSKRKGGKPKVGEIPMKQISDLDLVMPARNVHLRRFVESAVVKEGYRLNVRYEQQSLLTIMSLVTAGVASVVISWPSFHELWKDGKVDVRRIVSPKLSRTISLATPSNRPLSEAARVTHEVLLALLREEVQSGAWKGTLIKA